jgi:hypothetical protein
MKELPPKRYFCTTGRKFISETCDSDSSRVFHFPPPLPVLFLSVINDRKQVDVLISAYSVHYNIPKAVINVLQSNIICFKNSGLRY